MVSTIAFVSVTTGLNVFMMWQCGIFPSASSFNTVGMRLLSYNMTTDQYVNTTITRFVTVVAYNQMVISTSTGKPLVVDQNPVQKVYAQLPDGLVTLLSVTDLRVGFKLFQPLSQTWVSITNIQYQNSGIHTMYDVYTSAPGNYIANGYMDPLKDGPH